MFEQDHAAVCPRQLDHDVEAVVDRRVGLQRRDALDEPLQLIPERYVIEVT